MKTLTFELAEHQAGERLDKALATLDSTWTRTYIKQLIDDALVFVDGHLAKASYKVKGGESIEMRIEEEAPSTIEPVAMNLSFVYEDEEIVVVDKPSGLTVHPAQTVKGHTLVHGLLSQVDTLSEGEQFRPGIVHRIDKDTSGLLVVAKNKAALLTLQKALKEHKVDREYIALVEGVIDHNKGKIDAPIGRDKKHRQNMTVTGSGRTSITHFNVLERFEAHTLIACRLESGRTHQIRVHMKYIGHPLVGDPKYGKKKTDTTYGQYLHAKTLAFSHPSTSEMMRFEAPLPDYFTKKIEALRG